MRSAPAAVDAQVEAFLETVDNARFAAFVRQILVELHTHRDAPERALAHLEKLVEGGLADLDWLLRCPTFAELREHPLFRDKFEKLVEDYFKSDHLSSQITKQLDSEKHGPYFETVLATDGYGLLFQLNYLVNTW